MVMPDLSDSPRCHMGTLQRLQRPMQNLLNPEADPVAMSLLVEDSSVPEALNGKGGHRVKIQWRCKRIERRKGVIW